MRTDEEPASRGVAEAAKTRRRKHVVLGEGRLKDSAGMGAIEGPIRWWQARVRAFRYDLEKRYAVLLTADDSMWCWLTRYAGWATSVYRVRGDGVASYKAAFVVNYTGEILPCVATALLTVAAIHPAYGHRFVVITVGRRFLAWSSIALADSCRSRFFPSSSPFVLSRIHS